VVEKMKVGDTVEVFSRRCSFKMRKSYGKGFYNGNINEGYSAYGTLSIPVIRMIKVNPIARAHHMPFFKDSYRFDDKYLETTRIVLIGKRMTMEYLTKPRPPQR
jgi:hypothetical protein